MTKNQQSENQTFQEQRQYLRSDVKKVIITNALIIALLVGLYFLDQKIGLVAKLGQYF